jgi:5'-nucleotidase
LNVNIPDLPADKIRGVRITRQGNSRCLEMYDRRVDPRNHVYYWLTNECVVRDDDPEADSRALASGYISVTPIHHDLTNYPMLKKLREWGL